MATNTSGGGVVEEKWLPVPGFDGYSVSSLGQVASCWTNVSLGRKGFAWQRGSAPRILRQPATPQGYLQVTLYSNGVPHKRRVAHLVLEAFVSPRQPGMVCCHGPKGKQCNEVGNLSWGTYSKNLGEDKVRDGTDNRGEKQGAAKLTREDVKAIRQRLTAGGTLRAVAREFNVCHQLVSNIKLKKRWAWLED